jgi:hypothetical protein
VPQPNDAELTRIITVSTGTTVEDSEPNTGAPGAQPAGNFQLIVDGVAGNVIGPSLAPYVLELTCIDEVLAAPNPALGVGPLNQKFGDGGDGWSGPVGAVGNMTMSQTKTINVPPGLRGHVFHYVGTLVDQNGQVVSFVDSNRFILV